MDDIKRDNPFQGTVWQVLQQHCPDSNDTLTRALWQTPEFLTTLKSTENAKKSMAVLKKHLPEKYHSLIRFAQPKNIWYLNVEKGITATRLNPLLDDLSLRLAKAIGYAPKIKVVVQASQWQRSGLLLSDFTPVKIPLPSDEEADKIIADFVNGNNATE